MVMVCTVQLPHIYGIHVGSSPEGSGSLRLMVCCAHVFQGVQLLQSQWRAWWCGHQVCFCAFTCRDTSGQGRFSTIIRSYSRGAQGIILVYDITNRWSFDGLGRWLQEVEKVTACLYATACRCVQPLELMSQWGARRSKIEADLVEEKKDSTELLTEGRKKQVKAKNTKDAPL